MNCCRRSRARKATNIANRLARAGLFKEAQAVEEITSDKWKSLPKGWNQDSLKKFWNSLTGDRKHKITKCIEKMKGKVDDPGAFCGGLASRVGYR